MDMSTELSNLEWSGKTLMEAHISLYMNQKFHKFHHKSLTQNKSMNSQQTWQNTSSWVGQKCSNLSLGYCYYRSQFGDPTKHITDG